MKDGRWKIEDRKTEGVVKAWESTIQRNLRLRFPHPFQNNIRNVRLAPHHRRVPDQFPLPLGGIPPGGLTVPKPPLPNADRILYLPMV